MSELPPGWVEARLDEITHIILGQSPPGSSYNKDGIGLPFLQGKAEFGELRPAILKWTTDPRKTAKSGDILLSVRAPVGPTNVAPCNCAIGRGLAAIRPLGGIDPIYVRHALRVTEAALVGRATGTTFDAVSGNQVREHHLPVAPLAEQRRIVAAIEEQLSRLDAGEFSIRRAARRLNSMRSAILQGLLSGWPERPIGEIGQVFVGSTPSRSRPELWRGPVPWVSSGEVAFRRIVTTRETISEGALGGSIRLHPRGTVLLAMIGEGKTRGQAAILDVPASHNQNSAAIRLDPNLATPEWLFHVLMAKYAETRVVGSGNNQPALSKDRVRRIPVPLPPLDEQRRIVAELEEKLSVIDAMRAAVERALLRSKALRRAILERAFCGELVPQDPSDEPASVLLERIRAERAAAGPPRRRSSVRSGHRAEERIVSRAGGEYDQTANPATTRK